MSENTQFDFPDLLEMALDPFARGFGLNPSAATLLLLQMTGAIIGPSVQTRTPDMMDLTSAFDVACIHDGRALLHGALLSAFEGARREILDAGGAQETFDRRDLFDKKRKLRSQHAEMMAKIQEAESMLASPESPVATRSLIERVSVGFHWATAKVKIKEQLSEWQNQLADVQQQLLDLILVLQPGVICEGNDWREFCDAGRHSFDGHCFQISEAGSLLAETNSKSNRLKECTELLQRSRSDSPISGFDSKDKQYRATLHLSGTQEDFSALLRHPRIKSLGMLNSFVFCESDGDSAPDSEAYDWFLNHEWHQFTARQFRLRAAGERTFLALDQEGCKRYFAFREWCREFNSELPVEKRVHFLRWPEVMVRIATSLAAIADDTANRILEVQYLESADAMLRDYAVQQAAVLGRLLDRKPDTTRLDEGVEKLVQSLREKGPQTQRQLARGIHGQDYRVIDARIFEAIRRGLIVQSDGRYCVVPVSVNASTELGATENGGGIAA